MPTLPWDQIEDIQQQMEELVDENNELRLENIALKAQLARYEATKGEGH